MPDGWSFTLETLAGQMLPAPITWPKAARHVHRITDDSGESRQRPPKQVARPRAPAQPGRPRAGLGMLANIPEQGMTAAEVAALLGCERCAAAKRLARLRELGLVRHDRDTARYFRTST